MLMCHFIFYLLNETIYSQIKIALLDPVLVHKVFASLINYFKTILLYFSFYFWEPSHN
jgi:hypothetical protein